MPREISGQQPISKSQKNKWRKKSKPVQMHGGVCSRCEQRSNSATPGTIHVTCGEPTKQFVFLDGINASVLRAYVMPGGLGKWLSQSEYQQYKIDTHAYMTELRNFNTALNRWENGFGEPICFKTREVLPNAPLKVSMQKQSVPVDKMEIVLDEEMEEWNSSTVEEQKAA